MKREFLEGLDLGEGVKLPKTAIDAILDENGRDLEAQKTTITTLTQERDGLQTQLAEAQNRLNSSQEWEKKYNTDTQNLQGQITALQKDINTRNAREKVSANTGVPANLLTGDTEEACKAQADAILAWRGAQPKYPDAKDGGEPSTGGGGDPHGSAWLSVSESLNN